MDFLDPKRKKAHHRRVLIGYLLMAVALAMATWLLLNSSFGYWVDPKTGEVIQNGTVFVDSKPGGSSIELDGVMQSNRTATKLVLPGSRQYKIKLTNDGYEDWERTFALEGRHIERLTYPLLVPKQLETKDIQLYASVPGVSSQSPDRRWLLVQQPGTTYSFDLYDLNSPTSAPAVVTIPSTLLTEAAVASTLKIVEWADDNNHVLIDREYGGKHEFLLINTEDATGGLNINTALKVAPSKVLLRDKKSDQLYIYIAEGGVLRSAETKNRLISEPILSSIIDFKSYGSDLILYVTRDGAPEGKARFRVRENDKATYMLREVPDSSTFLIDIAEYDGTPYYVVGSGTVDAVFVYRDPLPILKGQRSASLLVSVVLRMVQPHFLSFSSSSQFIAVQSENRFIVLDLEADRQFKVTVPYEITTAEKVAWMDGHRLALTSKGVSYMVDFDGSNARKLAPSVDSGGPFFAPDFRSLYTLAPSASVNGRFAFTQTSLVKK